MGGGGSGMMNEAAIESVFFNHPKVHHTDSGLVCFFSHLYNQKRRFKELHLDTIRLLKRKSNHVIPKNLKILLQIKVNFLHLHNEGNKIDLPAIPCICEYVDSYIIFGRQLPKNAAISLLKFRELRSNIKLQITTRNFSLTLIKMAEFVTNVLAFITSLLIKGIKLFIFFVRNLIYLIRVQLYRRIDETARL